MVKPPETSTSGGSGQAGSPCWRPHPSTPRAEVLREGHLEGCNLAPQEGRQLTNPQPLSPLNLPAAAPHWLTQPEARGPGGSASGAERRGECAPAGTNGECPVQTWTAGAGRLLQIVSRHVGGAWKPKSGLGDPCSSHLLTPPASYRTVTSHPSRGSKRPSRSTRSCSEAEQTTWTGTEVALLVKAECHLPLPGEDGAPPTSSWLPGPAGSSQSPRGL